MTGKGGDAASAIEFLRGVIASLTSPHDGFVQDIRGPPYLTPEDQALAQTQLQQIERPPQIASSIPSRPPPISPVVLLGDELDQRVATLVLLVPGKAHIVGHLIGKGGAEVGKIEREVSVTIKIESASKMSVQLMERSVCIVGSVASVTLAQQFVSHKVHEKLLSEGVQAEVLKMLVPNEIVRHLIGKSGSNINRLQNESGARIQVEPESTMSSGAVGRTIVLQGSERCRTFAQYLILRQIAEDRNVHTEWAGRAPNPHQAPGAIGLDEGYIGSPNVTKNNSHALRSSLAQLATGPRPKHGENGESFERSNELFSVPQQNPVMKEPMQFHPNFQGSGRNGPNFV
jgi:transcription antitermination factor NusA-like protein